MCDAVSTTAYEPSLERLKELIADVFGDEKDPEVFSYIQSGAVNSEEVESELLQQADKLWQAASRDMEQYESNRAAHEREFQRQTIDARTTLTQLDKKRSLRKRRGRLGMETDSLEESGRAGFGIQADLPS